MSVNEMYVLNMNEYGHEGVVNVYVELLIIFVHLNIFS